MAQESNTQESFHFSVSNTVEYKSSNLTQQGQNGVCFFATGTTFTTKEETKAVKSAEIRFFEQKAQFEVNLNIWNNRTCLLANNDFNDEHFKAIVEMGEAAVPFIMDELSKGPTSLVHALDLIYPNMVEYEGYIPLAALCELWVRILKPTNNF